LNGADFGTGVMSFIPLYREVKSSTESSSSKFWDGCGL
jgi:hypothetical protein